MCGIFCHVGKDSLPLTKSNIRSITNSMNHRGPDSTGIKSYLNERITFIHSRLSIIDQSINGSQPMTLNGVTLIYNGEIYNYRDLIISESIKEEELKSSTDTEVIIHLYLKYGTNFVKLLKGMWAFVIFDSKKNTLFASRDRVGMKPLYLHTNKKVFMLSSEIKSIISSDCYKVEFDYDAFNEYMGFQNIISDKTLFKNINMLMPGHNLEYFLDNNDYVINPYWDLDLSDKLDVSFDDAVNTVDALLDKSIKRHLIGERLIGITLSGGIDSSTVLNYASKHLNNINTFTGYFDFVKHNSSEYCNNENEEAASLSKKYQTTHHEFEIKPNDVFDNIDEIVWHLEDPRVGASYTFYLLSKLVSEHVVVNLSGTGGDELFGGYTWRLDAVEEVPIESFDDEFYKISQRLLKDNEKKLAFTDNLLQQINLDESRASFHKVIDRSSNFEKLDRVFYFEFKTLLHGFLMVEDKLGMASSIETRFPLLDYDLIEYVSKLPSHYKHSSGNSKLILKKIAEGFLAKESISKKKQGFTPPELTWYGTILNKETRHFLLSKNSNLTKLIKKEFIERTLLEIINGKDRRALIWSFIYIESWIRVFKPSNL